MAKQLKQPLMPWQQMVADVAGELIQVEEEIGGKLRPLWVPAYPEVVLTVPRQNGKTTLILAWELDRAFLWEPFDDKPQAIAYTAQSGSEARKKFRKDQAPLLRRSPFAEGATFRYAADDMGVEFRNGSSLTVWNNAEDSGHGSILDLGVMDEIFADQDDRREQSFLPAMATRHDRQKLITSTAGTEKSVVLNRKQAVGRAAVEAGRREGTAYFEWSADHKSDPEDPATWWSCMPALGFTITERTVRSALEEMRKENGDLAEFSRAWTNIPTNAAGDRVIPFEIWEQIVREAPQPRPVVFSVDVNPERSWGSIAVGAPGVGELVEHRSGTGWLVGRLVELAEKYSTPVAIDATGPAGTLIEPLEKARIRIVKYEARDYVYACQSFFDLCMDRKVRLWDGTPTDALDIAAAGATKRASGDGWAWSRKHDQAVISPFVALTLAVDAASKPLTRPFVM